MRLVEIKLANFRSFESSTAIPLDPLTMLVGRNDAGKSTILEALDIFFNDVAIEKEDCNVRTGSTDISITCVFDDLPNEVVIDESYQTALADEYLLREDKKLEIKKTYSCTSTKGKLTGITAYARHPSAPDVNDLVGLKISDLKQRARQRTVPLDGVNQSVKSLLRKAIWAHCSELQLVDQEVSLLKEGGKEIWEQLQRHLPVYALFKSDRASTDQDAEAQDPLKLAIKEAIRRRELDLDGVLRDIQSELENVANRTVEKIREMDPHLGGQLKPTVKTKNWDSLFGVSLTGDDDIPINKRGSGTRRVVLLNFFRAKAEEMSTGKQTGVIYAIEEPETSQHPNNQLMLLDAFQDLSEQPHCQVLLTTHTPTLARRVDRRVLRLISAESAGVRIGHGSEESTLSAIKTTLGVLPDHDVKVFLGVEGKNDMHFLRSIAGILSRAEMDIPDLAAEERSGRLVMLSLGGGNLDSWINTMAGIGRPEFYLTDRDTIPPDPPKYQSFLEQWSRRGCKAWVTSKRELENYLCPRILAELQPGYSGTGGDFEDVPELFARAVHDSASNVEPWEQLTPEMRKSKESRAKKILNTLAVSKMTPDHVTQRDPSGDIREWLRELGKALQ